MVNSSELSIHCQSCSLSHLCLPVSLDKDELESLDDIIERKKPLHKNDKLVRFGDPNMTIKKSNPKRRASFRARHNCDTAKDKFSARYWSCKKW